jgi:4-hydroxy-tetrahydrodipicolinate reductase
MTTDGRTYRVAQWATGNVGTQALRAVIEHPRMELVGLHVFSDAKAGRDAGELCGKPPLGVKATRSLDAILAAKPDCVVYTPLLMDADDLCRLLEAGCNVSTALVEVHHPPSMDPALRERIEAACRRGGASLHATGSSPGFISEILPPALLSMSRRLDCLTIDEFADLTSRDSPELIFRYMGWGKPPTDFADEQIRHINAGFGQALRALADSLAIPIERVEARGEWGVARRRTQIAAGVIEAGNVAGSRITVEAFRGEEAVLRFRANWYATTDLEQDWDLGQSSGWRVRVEGDTCLDVRITFPVSEAYYPTMTPGLTAHPVVNAIPALCAAEPGIRTAAELKMLPILG